MSDSNGMAITLESITPRQKQFFGGMVEKSAGLREILTSLQENPMLAKAVMAAALGIPGMLGGGAVSSLLGGGFGPGAFGGGLAGAGVGAFGSKQLLAELLAQDVKLSQIARGTPGFTGADLEARVNESASRAAVNDKDQVHMDDLEEARDRVRVGRQKKKSRIMSEEDR